MYHNNKSLYIINYSLMLFYHILRSLLFFFFQLCKFIFFKNNFVKIFKFFHFYIIISFNTSEKRLIIINERNIIQNNCAYSLVFVAGSAKIGGGYIFLCSVKEPNYIFNN